MSTLYKRSVKLAVRQSKLAGLYQNPIRAIILLVVLLTVSWSQGTPSSMGKILRIQWEGKSAFGQSSNIIDQEDDFPDLDQAAMNNAPQELVMDRAYDKEYQGSYDVTPSQFIDVLDPSQFASKEANAGRFKHGTISRKFKNGDSAAQFIYLVGVEGAGHHGVAILLEHMARYANMNFYMRDRRTRRGIRHHNSGMLATAMKSRINDSSGRKHVILEDNSFPTGKHIKRHSKFESIKQEPRYDLEWIIKESEKAGADVKMLLLSRPFMNQVWSHRKWDRGFKGHANTLAHFMAYIDREMSAIGNEDIWRRIDYTWFSDEICPQVVPKLADFLNWPVPKDVAAFCNNTPFYLSKKKVDLDPQTLRWTQDLMTQSKPIWGVYERSDMALTQITQAEDTNDETEDDEENGDQDDSTMDEDSNDDQKETADQEALSEENEEGEKTTESEEENDESNGLDPINQALNRIDIAEENGGTEVDELENGDEQTDVPSSGNEEEENIEEEKDEKEQGEQEEEKEGGNEDTQTKGESAVAKEDEEEKGSEEQGEDKEKKGKSAMAKEDRKEQEEEGEEETINDDVNKENDEQDENDDDDFPDLDQSSMDNAPQELATDHAHKAYRGANDSKATDFIDVLDPSQFASKADNAGRFKHGTITRNFRNGTSAAQFIYLVGVEGAGHHGVAILLEHMARYANMNFYMRDRRTRRAIGIHNSNVLAEAMKSRIEDTSGRKHVILEDNSFPSGKVKRHNNFKSIKKEHRYDLEWIIKESEKTGADVKMLLLSRPFMNQVWSHKKWDGGFKGHANTLANYMSYIDQEISAIGNENIWRHIDYTWFSDEICPQVVPKLADFLNWPVPKDVVAFCRNTPFYLSKKKVDLDPQTLRWTENLVKKNKPNWGVYERGDMALTRITERAENRSNTTNSDDDLTTSN